MKTNTCSVFIPDITGAKRRWQSFNNGLHLLLYICFFYHVALRYLGTCGGRICVKYNVWTVLFGYYIMKTRKNTGVISVGELRKYKIGEVAELAGVSKRTVDYYTSLGLLSPLRSESNYRYYTQEALLRLKLIESMKEKRLTLEEIRKRLSLLDSNQVDKESISIDFIKNQLKQLEEQIIQLRPAASGLENSQANQLTQVLLQSMALINSIMLYINEIAPDVTKFL